MKGFTGHAVHVQKRNLLDTRLDTLATGLAGKDARAHVGRASRSGQTSHPPMTRYAMQHCQLQDTGTAGWPLQASQVYARGLPACFCSRLRSWSMFSNASEGPKLRVAERRCSGPGLLNAWHARQSWPIFGPGILQQNTAEKQEPFASVPSIEYGAAVLGTKVSRKPPKPMPRSRRKF